MTIAQNGAEWHPAVYFSKGRESTVQLIILHWMATSMAGADTTFTSGAREASAHFGLEDSKRHQYVLKQDTAWHANDHIINHKSIGIEHSAQPGRPATGLTILNSIALCTDLCREFSLTADAIHQHNEYSATQCPGTLPVARIREAVRAKLTTPPQEDDLPYTQAQLEQFAGTGVLSTAIGGTTTTNAAGQTIPLTVGVALDRIYKAAAGWNAQAIAAEVVKLLPPEAPASVDVTALASAFSDVMSKRLAS